MIRISEIKQPLSGTRDDLKKSCAALLKIDQSRIESLALVRRSIDSRKKDDVHFVFAVDVAVTGSEEALVKKAHSSRVGISPVYSYEEPENRRVSSLRPVIVGFGPAGIFAVSLMGGCVGYLRYNRYPARVFMGDTGSMFIGGATVGLAMILRQPLLLILIGICPLISSFSVILQRYYFKLTRRFSQDHQGRRLFRMSPVHHHFEKKGYTETQIVGMYAGVTAVAGMIAVLSLLG